ncbi:MAG: cytochrome P450 [Dehalococcoidia bacterium]
MTEETTPVPNMMDPAYIADPYPALNALRESAGAGPDASGAQWYVTRYDDVRRVLYDRELSADLRNAAPMTAGWFVAQASGEQSNEEISMLLLDEPDHTRLRKLVNKAFTPRAVEALRPAMEARAEELLDAVAGEPEFDLMPSFAMPFPTLIIAEMIGVDAADQAQFKAWSDLVVRGFDPFLGDAEKAEIASASAALHAYFEKAIAARRLAPRDDLISRLISAQEGGDRLTDLEMRVMLILLLNAGNLTTTDLIGNGVRALLAHPDQVEALSEDPSLVVNAVEEMLRYDSPVVETWRFSSEEETFSGCPIAAHQTIAPSLAATNHDPRQFADPERFDIGRQEIDHVSFGGGIHYCLGASLARLEAQVAVGALTRRFPGLHAAPGREPVFRATPGFHGMESFWVAG